MASAHRAWAGLTLGTIVLAASLSSAQAATLASTSAALTNLRITLVDLDPNDGIAPSVTFGPGFLSSFGEHVLDASGYQVSSTGTLFGATTSGTTGGAFYDISPTSIRLGASVDSADVAPANTDRGYYSTESAAVLEFASSSPDEFDNHWRVSSFTLSANTGLLISGTASATVATASHADVLAATTGSFDPARVDLTLLTADTAPSAEIAIILASSSVLTANTYAENAPNSTASNVHRSVYFKSLEEEAAEMHDSNPFVLSFANGSADSVEGALALSLQVSASVYASVWAANPGVPTIPEPSTYLLMGLGLAGIGLTCSHQRANSQRDAA